MHKLFAVWKIELFKPVLGPNGEQMSFTITEGLATWLSQAKLGRKTSLARQSWYILKDHKERIFCDSRKFNMEGQQVYCKDCYVIMTKTEGDRGTGEIETGGKGGGRRG